MSNEEEYLPVICQTCGHELRKGESVCPECAPQSGQKSNPYSAPVQSPAVAARAPGEPAPMEGDGTGGIIPYKNPKALLAYYLGIASGLPLIGLPFGIAAFVLGIMGLRDRKKNPVIKGSIHAGIGIGCGLIFTLFWSIAICGLIFAAVSQQP